jgi:uncharacterized protein YggU (UPF0235/DUF167 family)
VIPRASDNQIAEILHDGTIKIRLKSTSDAARLNQTLVSFLSEVLGVPSGMIDIVAGESGRSKLISIIDIDSRTVHKRIVQHLI